MRGEKFHPMMFRLELQHTLLPEKFVLDDKQCEGKVFLKATNANKKFTKVIFKTEYIYKKITNTWNAFWKEKQIFRQATLKKRSPTKQYNQNEIIALPIPDIAHMRSHI